MGSPTVAIIRADGLGLVLPWLLQYHRRPPRCDSEISSWTLLAGLSVRVGFLSNCSHSPSAYCCCWPHAQGKLSAEATFNIICGALLLLLISNVALTSVLTRSALRSVTAPKSRATSRPYRG